MAEARTVTLEWFAAFREACGRERETTATSARTLAELYDELRDRHGFRLPRESLRVAVNDDFVAWDRTVREGDRIAFIAPVAGG